MRSAWAGHWTTSGWCPTPMQPAMNVPNRKATLGRILLVDDESNLLQALAEALEAAGYEVETAEDGEEGLRKFAAQPPDVVVTDWAMPNLSGEEMASAIRALNLNVPIILISGLSRGRNAECLFDAILAKPFLSKTLISVVADVLLTAGKSNVE